MHPILKALVPSMWFIFAVLAGRTAAADLPPIRIVLVGDSTVTDSAGWGRAFAGAFNERVTTINHAKSGRSSKSYRDEGHWRRALADRPNYVFIQFGHNDCPGKGPARETKPDGEFAENLRRYLAEVRAANAQPVLITPVTRRRFDAEGRIQSILTPYAAAARKVATDTGTPLIDLHAASVAKCEAIGPAASARLGPEGDSTHFNAEGARVTTGLILKDLAVAVPALSAWLRRP